MKQSELNEVLRLHKLWIENNKDGVRADLERADLRCADLGGADLRGADLMGADLERADLDGADLRCAHLKGVIFRGADLRCADLRGANLWGAFGNMKNIKSMQIEKYSITYTHKIMQINCQNYPISRWFEFSDDEIKAMDNGALEWWKKWKDVIKNIIEMSPAEPTGYEGE